MLIATADNSKTIPKFVVVDGCSQSTSKVSVLSFHCFGIRMPQYAVSCVEVSNDNTLRSLFEPVIVSRAAPFVVAGSHESAGSGIACFPYGVAADDSRASGSVPLVKLDASAVASVPVVGSVTFVDPVVVSVSAFAPLVEKFAAKLMSPLIVNERLASPVVSVSVRSPVRSDPPTMPGVGDASVT